MTRLVQYIEIDLDYCSRVYGVAPCTAAIPTTGDRKCYNTLRTCQDRANFGSALQTYRFAIDTDYLPAAIDAIPSITSISLTPSVISLGENLGVRSSLTVTFRDHQWGDTGPGFDKYFADRAHSPFDQGTFWGKFRARHPFVRGRSIRLIRGGETQPLVGMETRHFIIDSFDGPDASGHYRLVAKDALKLTDGDRALAPRPSDGRLNADITAAATSAVLAPAGVGDTGYPASGLLAIGGREICAYTRVGDTLTLTRAQNSTEAVAHAAQDRVQLCLVYTGVDAADVLSDLLTTYAGVDSAFVPLSSWQAETAAHLQRVYTAVIPQPTAVDKLASELIEQAGLAVWWDEIAQLIRLRVLRQSPLSAKIWSEDNICAGTFSTREQPNKRISQVRTYYGQRNPLRPLDEYDNYRSALGKIDAQNEADYGSPAIKTILSRWIPAFGQTTADRLNDILIARFATPPRKVSFEVLDDGVTAAPQLGEGVQVSWWCYQDDQGARVNVPVQVTSLEKRAAKTVVTGEELIFTGITIDDPNNRVIVIDSNAFNLDLKAVHDSIFPVITDPTGITVTCIVASGVTVGSTDTAVSAFDVGAGWPVALSITLRVDGRIQGKGGAGGSRTDSRAGQPEADGQRGGTALRARYPFTLVNSGQIYGGGGGGAARNDAVSGSYQAPAGGGGAGAQPGAGGTSFVDAPWSTGDAGSADAGGDGGGGEAPVPGSFGGDGGGPGLPGGVASSGTATPGAAGNAIDGVSYATITTAGTRAGPEIN